MQQSRLSKSVYNVLQNEISQHQWPHLEQIIKLLEDAIVKSAKNRQYLISQKCKQKIVELKLQIKKRNSYEYRIFYSSMEQLENKNHEEQNKFEKEWEKKLKKTEEDHNELIIKKIEKQREERDKYIQQIEIALPHTHSPDHEIHRLRYEEEHFAREGLFVEAQRVKERIEEREDQLNLKHKKLREANINMMIKDLEAKHHQEICAMEHRRDQKLFEAEKEKKKREKDLSQKHQREVKELKWICNEEMKRFS